MYCSSLPQDDQNSEAVQSLDTNIKSSFRKFNNTSLDTGTAGLSTLPCAIYFSKCYGIVCHLSRFFRLSRSSKAAWIQGRAQRVWNAASCPGNRDPHGGTCACVYVQPILVMRTHHFCTFFSLFLMLHCSLVQHCQYILQR